MFGFYTPILALQVICFIHAYRKNAEQRWYWWILLFPVVGCIIYIIHHFGNRTSLETVAENVKVVVNSNPRIELLEKEANHADSVTNKMNLADAYLSVGRVTDALVLYEQCAAGFMEDDPVLRMKLLAAHFANRDYKRAIHFGELLRNEKSFKDAEEKIALAWSYYHAGDQSKARSIFESMDQPFTNYAHRLEYCNFLKALNEDEVLALRLTEILQEFEVMKGRERKHYKSFLAGFQSLKDALTSKGSPGHSPRIA